MLFTEAHLREEVSAKARGLETFHARFKIHVAEVRLSKSVYDEHVCVTCERKQQIACTTPRAASKDGTTIVVNEDVFLFAVLARRGGLGDQGLEDDETISDGIPLSGFETITANVKVRDDDEQGGLLDACSLNLSKFVYARHSISRTDVSLQFGGTLSLCLDVLVFGDDMPIDQLNGTNHLGGVYSDFRSKSGKHQQSALAQERSADIGAVLDETESESPEVRTKPQVSCTAEDSKPKSTTDRFLSFLTTESECDSKDEEEHLEAPLRVESLRNGSLARVRATRTPVGEYSTTCQNGMIWTETPVISKIEAPHKLLLWSIQGPEETDDEDEDESDGEEIEAGFQSKKPSRMVLSSDKPGPPAKIGKLSPLQKCCMWLVDPSESPVVRLGEPLSLKKSCVKKVSQAMANNVQYIDEPSLSEPGSGDVTEEEEGDEDYEYNDSDEESEEGEDNVNQAGKLEKEGSSGSDEDTDDEFADKREFRTPSSVVAQSKTGANSKTGRVSASNSDGGSSGQERDELVDMLTRQVDGLRDYVADMQNELRVLSEHNAALKKRMEDLEEESSSVCANIQRELEAERLAHGASQQENDRLLSAIISLKAELDEEVQANRKKKKGFFGFSGMGKGRNKPNEKENFKANLT